MGNFFSNWNDVEVPDNYDTVDPCADKEGEELEACKKEHAPMMDDAVAPVEPGNAPVEPANAPVEPANASVEAAKVTEEAVEPVNAPVEPVKVTEEAVEPVVQQGGKRRHRRTRKKRTVRKQTRKPESL